jgi:hypothetical protein
MVWVAISPKGISRSVFIQSGLAINQNNYISKCLKPGLLPLLNRHYNDSNKYIFWPDLASSHYAKKAIEFLYENNIPFVPKAMNPANLPQVRPIEDFWSHLKSMVYDRGWEASSLVQLRHRISYCLGKLDLKFVQHLIGGVNRRLRNVIRHGV